MKFFKTHYALIALLFASLLFASCSDSNSDNPDPNPEPEPTETSHFDLWVTTDSYGGGGSSVKATVVLNVNSLEGDNVIDFKNNGVDVIAKLHQESVVKGGFYYQIPQEKDRFGKYKISNDKGIEIVKEVPFIKNTFLDRRYCNAWLDDNTLIFMAANGDKSKIIWTKLNTETMKVVAEGELDLPELPLAPNGKPSKLSTSGMASYRKADDMIIYTYQNNDDKTHFYAAFVNAKDMSVKSVVKEDRVEQIGSSAYGELLTQKTFYDSEGNFYIVCANKIPGTPGSTQQYSTILKINKGAYDFDKTYKSFMGNGEKDYYRGKIVTIDYLADIKVLLYIQNPTYTGAAEWGSDYNCYYAVLDLKTDKLTDLKLPFSEGVLSQRSVVVGDKAYIGVNPKTEPQSIYTYDIKTDKLTKGVTLSQGYVFQRIMYIEK